MRPFSIAQTVKLTSAITSTATTIPAGSSAMSLYNAGANIVYAAFGASVTVPVVGTWTPGLIAVPPGATQLLANPNSGSSLAYIAETAGGTLILSVGEGN